MTPRLLRLLPCGERGVLIELDDLDAVLAAEAVIRAHRQAGAWPGVVDVVPAARTLLLTVASAADLAAVRGELPTVLDQVGSAATTVAEELIEIEVTYDGPDLDDIAQVTGLTTAEVIAAHTGRPWRVGFGGFAPGFAYLTDGDPRLDVPRRAEPRTKVPPGAVGLAGTFSGIYPRSSPGGWQLLGRTEAVLWDVDRDPPALLRPGCRVQFVDRSRS